MLRVLTPVNRVVLDGRTIGYTILNNTNGRVRFLSNKTLADRAKDQVNGTKLNGFIESLTNYTGEHGSYCFTKPIPVVSLDGVVVGDITKFNHLRDSLVAYVSTLISSVLLYEGNSMTSTSIQVALSNLDYEIISDIPALMSSFKVVYSKLCTKALLDALDIKTKLLILLSGIMSTSGYEGVTLSFKDKQDGLEVTLHMPISMDTLIA